ncbi:nucleotidyltransferase domain-containing protein [Candidatus Bathyarchaeota archaeon]|nr:nucleotidyltransferase domain-containing protein [Candidatus Bathyarchaeota archaeon]MBS7617281.1 nucleotidyltransferase domain-containing protein [Candidatus Bathyarchaeota archaeon]
MFDESSFRLLLLLKVEGTTRFKDLKSVIRNPRTLSLKLRKLERLGLVENSNVGYRLTQKGFETCGILEELNRTLYSSEFKVENVEKIPHMYFAPLIRRYCKILNDLLKDRLVSIMLFGSIARGDWNKNSDIDVLVIANDWNDEPVWNRIRELRKAKEKLEESLEYQEALRAGYWPIIQNYPLSVEEAKRFNRIYLDAVIDGIILYDKGSFLTKLLQSLREKLEEMGSMRVTLPNRKFYWILKDLKAGEVITLE